MFFFVFPVFAVNGVEVDRAGCPFVVTLPENVRVKPKDIAVSTRKQHGATVHHYGLKWTESTENNWVFSCESGKGLFWKKSLHKEKCYMQPFPDPKNFCFASRRWDGVEYIEFILDGPLNEDRFSIWYFASVKDRGVMWMKVSNKSWRSRTSEGTASALEEMKRILGRIRVRDR